MGAVIGQSDAGAALAEQSEWRARRRLLWALSSALLLLLAHAFLPLHQFVHRGDDAYYYFKIAVNYPAYGFWTFDGRNSTNGVQPLWAILLTGVAQGLHWSGARDPDTLARIFVALTALLHFLSCVVLFHLLARTVSLGTGVAAAGGLLFPMGIVWSRVWGMENSLYALLLVSTVAWFHLVFRDRQTPRNAAILGLLLGLTALGRLNAGLFAVCLLGSHLLSSGRGERRARFRLAAVAAAATGAVLAPYFLMNYVTTGHLMPISGAVKTMLTADFLTRHAVDSRFSPRYLQLLVEQARGPLETFLGERGGDGLWIVGMRLATDGAVPLRLLLAAVGGLLALPFAFAGAEWPKRLRERFVRLSVFGPVLAFGLLDAALSIFLYPTQIRYAMTRWWLAQNEIIVAAVLATVAAATLRSIADSFLARAVAVKLLALVVAALFLFHAQQMARFYWRDTTEFRGWNLSWNDESFRASQWMARHLPADARVGSWNAGVLGYYAKQSVTNLDGLINNFDLLPYLKQKRVDAYVVKEGIHYLSDMEAMFKRHKLSERLTLTEVYRHHNPLMRGDYRIYRVDDVRPASRMPQRAEHHEEGDNGR